MKILGENFEVVDVFDSVVTVPDCFVLRKNKLGRGNGEKKLYVAPKKQMRNFFGEVGFRVKCFILKEDLIRYMRAMKLEYANPTQAYSSAQEFPALWEERMKKIESLDDRINFIAVDQKQIAKDRGYVKSSEMGYGLIRELALPLVSYISFMKLRDSEGKVVYYWRLFADFDAIADKKNALVFTYGKKKRSDSEHKQKKQGASEIQRSRIGQGKYRESLLEECPYCPITKINDERLLIASHIKPWALSDNAEKVDPKNGFILSPLYDRLFDKGFITFTDDRRVKISNWLSPQNKKRIGINEDQFFQMLPINDKKRREYLKFHRDCIFKG